MQLHPLGSNISIDANLMHFELILINFIFTRGSFLAEHRNSMATATVLKHTEISKKALIAKFLLFDIVS